MAQKPRIGKPNRPIERRGKGIHYTKEGGPPYCGQRQQRMPIVTTDILKEVNCKKCLIALANKGRGITARRQHHKDRVLVARPDTYMFKPSKEELEKVQKERLKKGPEVLQEMIEAKRKEKEQKQKEQKDGK